MNRHLLRVLLFAPLSILFLSCGSDKSSENDEDTSSIQSGKCADLANGITQVDSATGEVYYCENGVWIPESTQQTYQDTVRDGTYQCTDHQGNTASFVFRDNQVAISYSLPYSMGQNSFVSYQYSKSDTFENQHILGKDYSTILNASSHQYPLNHIQSRYFSALFYINALDSVAILNCTEESILENYTVNWEDPFNSKVHYGSLLDSRDNRKYKTIQIADMNWMAENLAFETTESSCFADNAVNCARFGRLYSWDFAMQGDSARDQSPSGVQGICPTGWHIPSLEEWKMLETYIQLTDSNVAEILSAKGIWMPDSTFHGNNQIGFSAVPGGQLSEYGDFEDLGIKTRWLTSTRKIITISQRSVRLNTEITNADARVSLRCVENYTRRIPFKQGINYGSLTDARDGQIYRTILIHNREWMAQNLNYETPSGSYCYNNDPSNCEYYGRIYHSNTAMQSEGKSYSIPSGVQGVCPTGWHLPSQGEVDSLEAFLISQNGGDLSIVPDLKAQWGWMNWDAESNINSTGFTALPGGYLRTNHFYDLGRGAEWWTASGTNGESHVSFGFSDGGTIATPIHDSTSGASIRCVRDFPSIADSVFGACSASNQGYVGTIKALNSTLTSFYTCDNGKWRMATELEEQDKIILDSLGQCTQALENVTKLVQLGYKEYRTCHSGSWELATYEESNSAKVADSAGQCTQALQYKVFKLEDTYYTCEDLLWGVSNSMEVCGYLVVQENGYCVAEHEGEIVSVIYLGVACRYRCDSGGWNRLMVE